MQQIQGSKQDQRPLLHLHDCVKTIKKEGEPQEVPPTLTHQFRWLLLFQHQQAPHSWEHGKVLWHSKARENEIASWAPKLSLRAQSHMRGFGFKVWLRKVQANWWKGLIKAVFRCGGLAEIDGCVTANNGGIPLAVNIMSLIWSKTVSESPARRWGGRGVEWEKDFRREFKEFYGQGRRGDCWLDLEGVKLFLLPSLSFFLSPIRGVRKQ